MGNYKIFETDEFKKELNKITSREKKFITKKINDYIYPQLRDEPHFGRNIKKLVDYKPPTWRFRIGKFRIFYICNEDKKIVYILSIDFSKDVF